MNNTTVIPGQGRKPIFPLLAVIAITAGVVAASRIPALADNAQATSTITAPETQDSSAMDPLALAKIIDDKIEAKLQANKIQASEKSTDAEFIRRVYLDIIGVIPAPERVKAFLKSSDPNKRSKLIDELLANPRYGRFFGEIWTNAMLPKESNNRRLQTEPLHRWLTEQLNTNVHWNKLVYDLITASGPQDKNPAVTFFIGNPTADKMTDRTTQLFLGVQLQCAQCHNHPFTDTKQDEYWGMAAFFMKVRLSANPQKAAKTGEAVAISEGPAFPKGKKKGLPDSAKIVPAKFLGAEQPKLNRAEPYRPVLAQWMTSGKNPYFARAAANKLWHHFLGRGIVNPVDDMHGDNPPTNPELLVVLEEQFKASNFDLKYLIRAICNSETYQRTSRPAGNNGDDKEFFSHALVRALSPEQLFDSLDAVLQNSAAAAQFAKAKAKAGVGKLFTPPGPRGQFITFFSTDDGFHPLEYQQGIPQALRLMNSRQINANTGAIARALKAGSSPAQVIEHLYLETLSRRPTQAELDRFTQYVRQQAEPRAAYGDVLWALLNSSEFAFNH